MPRLFIYKNGYQGLKLGVAYIQRRVASTRCSSDQDGGSHAPPLMIEQQRELADVAERPFEENARYGMCSGNPSGRPTKRVLWITTNILSLQDEIERLRLANATAQRSRWHRFNQRDEIGAFEWRNYAGEGSSSDRRQGPTITIQSTARVSSIRVPKMQLGRGIVGVGCRR